MIVYVNTRLDITSIKQFLHVRKLDDSIIVTDTDDLIDEIISDPSDVMIFDYKSDYELVSKLDSIISLIPELTVFVSNTSSGQLYVNFTDNIFVLPKMLNMMVYLWESPVFSLSNILTAEENNKEVFSIDDFADIDTENEVIEFKTIIEDLGEIDLASIRLMKLAKYQLSKAFEEDAVHSEEDPDAVINYENDTNDICEVDNEFGLEEDTELDDINDEVYEESSRVLDGLLYKRKPINISEYFDITDIIHVDDDEHITEETEQVIDNNTSVETEQVIDDNTSEETEQVIDNTSEELVQSDENTVNDDTIDKFNIESMSEEYDNTMTSDENSKFDTEEFENGEEDTIVEREQKTFVDKLRSTIFLESIRQSEDEYSIPCINQDYYNEEKDNTNEVKEQAESVDESSESSESADTEKDIIEFDNESYNLISGFSDEYDTADKNAEEDEEENECCTDLIGNSSLSVDEYIKAVENKSTNGGFCEPIINNDMKQDEQQVENVIEQTVCDNVIEQSTEEPVDKNATEETVDNNVEQQKIEENIVYKEYHEGDNTSQFDDIVEYKKHITDDTTIEPTKDKDFKEELKEIGEETSVVSGSSGLGKQTEFYARQSDFDAIQAKRKELMDNLSKVRKESPLPESKPKAEKHILSGDKTYTHPTTKVDKVVGIKIVEANDTINNNTNRSSLGRLRRRSVKIYRNAYEYFIDKLLLTDEMRKKLDEINNEVITENHKGNSLKLEKVLYDRGFIDDDAYIHFMKDYSNWQVLDLQDLMKRDVIVDEIWSIEESIENGIIQLCRDNRYAKGDENIICIACCEKALPLTKALSMQYERVDTYITLEKFIRIRLGRED